MFVVRVATTTQSQWKSAKQRISALENGPDHLLGVWLFERFNIYYLVEHLLSNCAAKLFLSKVSRTRETNNEQYIRSKLIKSKIFAASFAAACFVVGVVVSIRLLEK